jgi:hypothetical protein
VRVLVDSESTTFETTPNRVMCCDGSHRVIVGCVAWSTPQVHVQTLTNTGLGLVNNRHAVPLEQRLRLVEARLPEL